ncbi:class I SAM-dependent methyltransferase [Amphritea japonica]|uniref:Tellurite methyltransferase n=1 Tax=Amphritea japonica ATCC BAA-1530 TaxID=1278309 RepID=A0A7R6P380_9GAMM|nr:methyltransferase domain-containing protein [Amphritea japonica]BBB26194.1 tellurite methyltransferase [Amphritea japonica ATCC BAA-1530]
MTDTDGKAADRSALWNTRYRSKAKMIAPLPTGLQAKLQQLRKGRTLDLACGEGAASLQLAAEGHDVVAVDFAQEGLNRLQLFAEQQRVNVELHELDLNVQGALSALGRFDNIVVLRYLPELSLLRQLPDLMVPSGRLFISTFNQDHHRQTGFSQRFCLKPGELLNSLPQLSLIEYEDGTEKEEPMDSYIFQK